MAKRGQPQKGPRPARGVPQRWNSPLLLSLFLPLLLGLLPPVSAQEQQEKLDLQVTVFSSGTGPDIVAAAYAQKPDSQVVQQDFATIARELGIAAPKVKISTDENITVGEAKLPGLTNWSTGTVNLDPLVSAFRRYGRLRVSCFFGGDFPLSSPIGEGIAPPIRWETKVQQAPGATTVDYKVWVDQTAGVPAQLPSTTKPQREQTGWKLMAALAAVGAVILISLILIANVIMGQRRAAAAAQPDP